MLLPCGCRACCKCGTLPYTITVEFSDLENKTHSGYCPLAITSNFGGGAAAIVLAPGGCDDDEPECGSSNRGPITEVLLLDGGCGFARLGRVEPELQISGLGTGATFTVTWELDDTGDCDVWKIASVAVSGGSGYVDGETLEIALPARVFQSQPAVLLLAAGGTRSQPTITATAETSGTPASLTANVVPLITDPGLETWRVGSVTVNSGGTGYSEGDIVAFDTPHVESESGFGTVVTDRTEPTITVEIVPAGGTDAVITATLGSTTWQDGPAWEVTGFTIDNGGAGYSEGDELWAHADAGDTVENYEPDFFALGFVTAVDGNGAITSVSFDGSGKGFRAGDAIASVVVTAPGSYHNASGVGVPSAVTVDEAGAYYREDQDAPPCVAAISVDASACGGTDAVITAVVETDPEDPQFGVITGLTITDGGDDYLAWRWMCLPHEDLNGKPLVLRAGTPKPLVTLSVESCFGSGACVEIVPEGEAVECGSGETTLEWDGTPKEITNVLVTNGGGGYARIGRERPEWVIEDNGWTFTPSFNVADQFDDCGLPVWTVESVAISGSGSPVLPNRYRLNTTVLNPEKCEREALIVLTVEDGIPTEAAVVNGGIYYRENPSLPPHVASPTISVNKHPDATGAGAELVATVNSTVGDPEFGTISAVTIVDGGDSYQFLGGPSDCTYTGGCGDCEDGIQSPSVTLTTRGGRPAEVTLQDSRYEVGCEGVEHKSVYRSSSNVADCDELPTSAELYYGAPAGSVDITRGGTWDSRGAQGCGTGCDDCPDELVPCCTLQMNTAYNEATNTFVPAVFTAYDPCICDGTKVYAEGAGNFDCDGTPNIAGNCTVSWIAWYALTCDGVDPETGCATDCTLTLLHGPFVRVLTGCPCPDAEFDVSAWGAEISCD